ncbi:MAG: amino acid ABC transporter substrate-binding protein [Dehalococcoidales bacterium]|nr:amino acid ABC transporter substrate-binding protein [Dehalococcoidales bacterium]
MRKKLLLIPLALLLAISLIAIGCPTIPPEEPTTPTEPTTPPPDDIDTRDSIVIGQAVSLSGPLGPGNAVASTPYYDLWVTDVNAAGGIYVEEYGKKLPVELKIYDDTSDVSTMMRLLEKLITEDEVDFILPPWSTAMLFAAAPIAQKYEYILIGGAGGATKLKEVQLPYFFQVLNFGTTQVPTIADILVELGVQRVAIVFLNDLHGIEYSGLATPEFATRGLDVIMVKTYPVTIGDVSLMLKQAQSLDVDAFIGFSYPNDSMLITGTAIELGINFDVFFLSVCPAFTFYYDAFGPLTEGIMGGGAWNEKSSAEAAAFSAHYTEVTGEPMGNYWGSLYFYSSMQHLQQAIEEAGTLDQAVIRDLLATRTYETALGAFAYDDMQIFSANHPGEIGQWQNGVFEIIDPGAKRTAPPILKPDWPAPE